MEPYDGLSQTTRTLGNETRCPSLESVESRVLRRVLSNALLCLLNMQPRMEFRAPQSESGAILRSLWGHLALVLAVGLYHDHVHCYARPVKRLQHL